MQNSTNARPLDSMSPILDQPIPRSLYRRLEVPLIRTPTRKELKKLQKEVESIIITWNVTKAFNENLNVYQNISGDADGKASQDSEIFFADVRPYIKQLVLRKMKRYRPTGAGVSFDLVMVTCIRNRQSGEIDQFFTRSKRHYAFNNSEIDRYNI